MSVDVAALAKVGDFLVPNGKHEKCTWFTVGKKYEIKRIIGPNLVFCIEDDTGRDVYLDAHFTCFHLNHVDFFGGIGTIPDYKWRVVYD